MKFSARGIVGHVALAAVGVCLVAGCASGDDAGGPVATGSSPASTAPPASTTTPATVAPISTTDPPTSATVPMASADPVLVAGPIEGGRGMANAALVDLAASGYSEAEYFISGDATSYRPVGDLPPDGRWTVEPAEQAPFTTRVIVRVPDASRFSGTVLVEWLNVSGGADADPDWGYTSREIVREGHAWVGVSAQAVGVAGGSNVLGEASTGGGLVNADPDRYGSLVHPGDEFAFDIFTQAARALEVPDGPAPLGDLVATRQIAIGESQSAFFLSTYANAVQPLTRQFDGFLIHSRGAGVAPLGGQGITSGEPGTRGVQIREDSTVPILIFQTETDLTTLGYAAARQDDSDHVRVWEVAGTAHADEFLLVDVYGVGRDVDTSTLFDCPAPLNAGPQHEVLQAALHRLVAWVVDGVEPPPAPRLELVSVSPPVLARDERGIVLGGIRTPLVDVPAVILSGDPAPGAAGFCFLFGSTTPVDDTVLRDWYASAEDYLVAFEGSLRATIDAGFILDADAEGVREHARLHADRW